MLGRFSSLQVAHGAAGIGLLCWIVLVVLICWRSTQAEPKGTTGLPWAWIEHHPIDRPTADHQIPVEDAEDGEPAVASDLSCPDIDDFRMEVRVALGQIERELRVLRTQAHSSSFIEIEQRLTAIQQQLAVQQQITVHGDQHNTQYAMLSQRIERLTKLIGQMNRPADPPISALTAIPAPELVTKLYPLDDLTVADVRPLVEPLLSPDVGLLASTAETSTAERSAILVRDRVEVIAKVDQLLAELTARPFQIELQISQDTTTSSAIATPAQSRFTTAHGQPIRWIGDVLEAAPCAEPAWVTVETETEFLAPRPATQPRLQLSITPRIVRERR
ncbi:hypothetical protein GC163_10580 [bacterium]|nr:hypothetical protein [bacterium]